MAAVRVGKVLAMSLRFVLAAAAALTAATLISAPAFALQSIQIPDPSAPNSAQNDPLTDGSAPNRWEEQKGDDQSTGLGQFHFTMGSSSGWGSTSMGAGALSQTPSTYGDPKTAGSEFYQPVPGYVGTAFPH
jgi:hypothetical protein